MKTFIPHVYFSAPEDTVGDLVNQIRRESEIPGTAEPKPEMKERQEIYYPEDGGLCARKGHRGRPHRATAQGT